MASAGEPGRDEFTAFVREMEPRLRFALAGTASPEVVREAVQEALVYAWSHWDRVSSTSNPGGYLYRVAKRRTWRHRRLRPVPADPPVDGARWVEPGLPAALASLSARRLVLTKIRVVVWASIRASSRP